MQWLAALCVRRPVFASVLILSLTVIGVFSFTKLGVDRFPKVDIPTVIITTVQPGAAPEQIETEITDKIEEAVNTISGIDELRSVSSEGISQVMVGFTLDKETFPCSQCHDDKDLRANLEPRPKLLAASPPRPEQQQRAIHRRPARLRPIGGPVTPSPPGSGQPLPLSRPTPRRARLRP